VYCQPCWLFPEKTTSGSQNVWVTGFGDVKHILERVKLSCDVYEQWQKHGTLDEVLEEDR